MSERPATMVAVRAKRRTGSACVHQSHRCTVYFTVENSVVDPKLFITDPDPTFQ
jgi:hypothetical protein